jgi:hypothetical protein
MENTNAYFTFLNHLKSEVQSSSQARRLVI